MTAVVFIALVYAFVVIMGISSGATTVSDGYKQRARGWLWQQFALGFLCATSLYGALEDWYGLDGWIEQLRAHWANLPWWVGGAVAFGAYMTAWRCRVHVMQATQRAEDDLRSRGVL